MRGEREGVNNEFRWRKEKEDTRPIQEDGSKNCARSERDWSTDTEMSKGGESQRENGLGTARSGLGRKGWGGSRKALKEHPPPCLSIKELRIPFPQGGRGGELHPRPLTPRSSPEAPPPRPPERCPLETGCAAPIDGGGPSWCVISLLQEPA